MLQLSMWEAIATILDVSVDDLSNMEISSDDSGEGMSRVLVELNIRSKYNEKAVAEMMSLSSATLVQLLTNDATVNGYQHASSLDKVRLIAAYSMTDNPTPAPSIVPSEAPTHVSSASPSKNPSASPSLYPIPLPTLKPSPLPSTIIFDHCSLHITVAGLSEYTLGGSPVLQKVFFFSTICDFYVFFNYPAFKLFRCDHDLMDTGVSRSSQRAA